MVATAAATLHWYQPWYYTHEHIYIYIYTHATRTGARASARSLARGCTVMIAHYPRRNRLSCQDRVPRRCLQPRLAQTNCRASGCRELTNLIRRQRRHKAVFERLALPSVGTSKLSHKCACRQAEKQPASHPARLSASSIVTCSSCVNAHLVRPSAGLQSAMTRRFMCTRAHTRSLEDKIAKRETVTIT